MGLDSVELMMETENYFRIRIPDPEAESIATIQNMCDAVAQHLNIQSDSVHLRNRVFDLFSEKMAQQNNPAISMTDNIAAYLSVEHDQKWVGLASALALELPRPEKSILKSNKFLDRFMQMIAWKPNYDWNSISVERFIDAVCAANYKSLVNRDAISSKHEIYIAVMGITAEKIGVDLFEILPEKSFTSDLGVD